MKTSLNWLRQYIDIEQSPESIGEILTGTGLEVEGIEIVESIRGGLAGVVVGEVVRCIKHPEADKLSLTEVNIGGESPLQIVCGAPNVAQGQKVLVATVGSTIYPTEGEPIKLKKGKIRGAVSEGMICAEDELGLGRSHEGILVLPPESVVGTPAAAVFQLENDYVFEIGLTPNRSDATNHLGVAFDIAAAVSVNEGKKMRVRRPDLAAFRPGTAPCLPVHIADAASCPRYAGLIIDQIQLGPSPDWLRQRLQAIGLKSINNVVDVTNFVLHEMGQPLHAFDLDKIGGGAIKVQTLAAGTPFLALDEQERKLFAEDLMICDAHDKPLCIAGVFGGIDSGVSEQTMRIFLESAHFEAGSVRRSSLKHTLRTDAAKIFEKGSDPNICVDALKRAALLLQEVAGARVSSELLDIYPQPVKPLQIEVRYRRVRDLIGVNLSREDIRSILETMDMAFVADSETQFTVAVPTNKSDVTREVDVIEEVLRIYGFNKVEMPKEISSSLVVAPHPDPYAVRELIADLLAANGYHEMMAMSLSESRYYGGGMAAERIEKLVYINNTSNVHLDIMRPDMLMSGLEAVLRNGNRKKQNLRLFEFGRTYHLEAGKYEEVNHLSLVLSGSKHENNWHTRGEQPFNYYSLKSAVELILGRLGITNYRQRETQDEALAYGLEAYAGPMTLVSYGKVARQTLEKVGIKGDVFYADFNWDTIFRLLPKKRMQVEELNKYPSVKRDLALVINKSISYATLEEAAKKTEKKLLTAVNLFDVYENEEQLGKGKKSYALSFLFENKERTLKDKEVDQAINRLVETFTRQLGAEIRR